ncbi:Gephyrin [Bagarius yarrelli]|uniref:Gephyrin n=1 Tax=Bagarius yarrelli TaxID=175774 RepID=A0A556TT44_BAGYA|nr:Gephyrin [Bagarius yarrelli]
MPRPFPEFGALDTRGLRAEFSALVTMASDGMILTNHDHQIRVGVLTGNIKAFSSLCEEKTPYLRRVGGEPRGCVLMLMLMLLLVDISD